MTARWSKRELSEMAATDDPDESRREIDAYVDGVAAFDEGRDEEMTGDCPECDAVVHYLWRDWDDVACLNCGERLRGNSQTVVDGEFLITSRWLERRSEDR